MFDAFQIFQTCTVVKFIEYDNLCFTNIAIVNQSQPHFLISPIFYRVLTLYAGYFFASKYLTCDAMKPAPPVTRIDLGMSVVDQYDQVDLCSVTRLTSNFKRDEARGLRFSLNYLLKEVDAPAGQRPRS